MNAKTTIFRHAALETRRLLGAIVMLSLFCATTPGNAQSFTLPEQLIGVTEGFLEYTVQEYLTTNQIQGRHEIQVRSLDPRMRMAFCDKDLTASLESPRPVGRISVRVRCEGSAPWTVFVPAQVNLYREVITTTRPLKRDTVISEMDVTLRERDISSLGLSYMTSLDQAIGQKLVRPAVVDQVLSPNFLEQPAMVRKGDHVVIIARSSSLAVRMPGEALSDGGFNEQIRVRNLNSNKVIKAQITAPGQVEVAM
ncbi:flagellar basal body P-ring formation chaperone FlgA [Pseudomonas sp. 21LCFQ02]|uniref:flagellar basal body P-ring formation chaperone FlgA n=1 Tax=unclassified Pseudomonas TaxID=196821 RepID=UPI0005EFB1F0|nr:MULTISPECIES: flagellar basal body P-ring formation chaperone FlgA [unclassified Pseudomonas]MCO8167309.1 flagellar basal body P-ring formation chaperone FlgA [Pseudomonas sp. 21LCFQ02]MCQ9424885.1 flagellar basal body P-ring formation chaperone FlgA [Pseudomonas sp. LJDD11]